MGAAMRRITLPLHALVEFAAGLVLLAASLALDLGIAGMLATFAAGVTLTGMGLGAADSLPLSAHQALDRWLATLLAAAAIALSLSGDAVAGAVLVGTAVALLALGAGTRWTRPLAPQTRLGAR